MRFEDFSLCEIKEMLKNNKITSFELVEYFINKIKENKKYNAVIDIFEGYEDLAKKADELIKSGVEKELLGIPVLISDLINFKGNKMTCSSKFMQDYVAVYNATIVDKLLDAGAIIIGRTNTSEFGLSLSTKTSINGPTHNAINFNNEAGSGMAAAIALGFAPIGVDCDSRISAAMNGVVALKPSIGQISRFGVFMCSLDQVGIVSRKVEDSSYVLNVLSGKSENDDYSKEVDKKLKDVDLFNLKIAFLNNALDFIDDIKIKEAYLNVIEKIKNKKFKVENLDVEDFKYCLPAYEILREAEVSSNLDKFDGVKYTERDNSIKNVYDFYNKTRSKYFSDDAKLHVMLGNFVISADYFNDYFNKSKLIQSKFLNNKENLFNKYDLIILPTIKNFDNSIDKEYDFNDNFELARLTSFANISNLPAITIPLKNEDDKKLLNLQIISKDYEEEKIFKFAKFIEENWR